MLFIPEPEWLADILRLGWDNVLTERPGVQSSPNDERRLPRRHSSFSRVISIFYLSLARRAPINKARPTVQQSFPSE